MIWHERFQTLTAAHVLGFEGYEKSFLSTGFSLICFVNAYQVGP